MSVSLVTSPSKQICRIVLETVASMRSDPPFLVSFGAGVVANFTSLVYGARAACVRGHTAEAPPVVCDLLGLVESPISPQLFQAQESHLLHRASLFLGLGD